METTLDEIAKIVTISKPIIDPLIQALISPSIEKIKGWLKKEQIKTKLVEDFFESKVRDYLSVTLERCSNVNLLIFQNQQIKLQDIYFPLTLVSSKKETDKYKLSDFNKKLFSKHKKVLISDTAGMGKSTVSKWITKCSIEEKVAIPILVELRNLRENHTLLDEIFIQFNPIDRDFDKDLILKFIELGKFIIILDGFDEIQHKSQETIIKDIRTFINSAGNNWFLFTSRPEGALAAFGDFQSFNIKPLEKNEPYELIEKYDSIAPIKISSNLIKDIKEKYDQVSELLGNPFLVSLLYSTYTYNKDIPSNKLSFYDEIYQALYKRHDLSKDGWTRPKHSNLDIQQFRTVLRQLAFNTSLLGETNYSETKLTDLVSNAIESCPGISSKAPDFINDILSTVPIFQRDGFKIKWAHKSFQDFFSAEYITYDSNKEVFLNNIYDSGFFAFNNILDFLAELDYKSFRKIVVKKLLLEFVDFYENSYQEFNDGPIKSEYLNLRKCKTFGTTVFFISSTGERTLRSLLDEITPPNSNFKNTTTTTISITGGNYFKVSMATLNNVIIEILARQKVNYICQCDGPNHSSLKLKLKINQKYYVNDDKNSLLNKYRIFHLITQALDVPKILYRKGGSVTLNYIEAKKELEAIEKENISDASLKAFKMFTDI